MALVVDDDVELRDSLVDCLSEDYTALGAENADAAVALLAERSVDFVVSDVRAAGAADQASRRLGDLTREVYRIERDLRWDD